MPIDFRGTPLTAGDLVLGFNRPDFSKENRPHVRVGLNDNLTGTPEHEIKPTRIFAIDRSDDGRNFELIPIPEAPATQHRCKEIIRSRLKGESATLVSDKIGAYYYQWRLETFETPDNVTYVVVNEWRKDGNAKRAKPRSDETHIYIAGDDEEVARVCQKLENGSLPIKRKRRWKTAARA